MATPITKILLQLQKLDTKEKKLKDELSKVTKEREEKLAELMASYGSEPSMYRSIPPQAIVSPTDTLSLPHTPGFSGPSRSPFTPPETPGGVIRLRPDTEGPREAVRGRVGVDTTIKYEPIDDNDTQDSEQFTFDTPDPKVKAALKYNKNIPILVQQRNGFWVELRCPICSGNTHERTGDYFRGASGFRLHLKRSHDVDLEQVDDVERAVVEFCFLRHVTAKQITALSRSQKNAPKFEKVVCKSVNESDVPTDVKRKLRRLMTANGEETGANAIADASFEEMLDKRPVHVLGSDGLWLELQCPACFASGTSVDGVYDLQSLADHMRHVHSMNVPHDLNADMRTFIGMTAYRKLSAEEARPLQALHAQTGLDILYQAGLHLDEMEQSLQSDQHKRRTTTEHANTAKRIKQASTTTNHGPSISDIFFDDAEPAHLDIFCPCTLSGHACESRTCQRPQVCWNKHHGRRCPPHAVHSIESTCADEALFFTCAVGSQCLQGHDHMTERRAIYKGHSHVNHE